MGRHKPSMIPSHLAWAHSTISWVPEPCIVTQTWKGPVLDLSGGQLADAEGSVADTGGHLAVTEYPVTDKGGPLVVTGGHLGDTAGPLTEMGCQMAVTPQVLLPIQEAIGCLQSFWLA